MVGALRETSILFTMLIGYFFLKEKITAIKIFSILMILSGVIHIELMLVLRCQIGILNLITSQRSMSGSLKY